MAEERYVKETDYNDRAVILVSRNPGDVVAVPLPDGETIVGDASDPRGFSTVAPGEGGGGITPAYFMSKDGSETNLLVHDVQAELSLAALEVTASQGISIELDEDDLPTNFIVLAEAGVYNLSVSFELYVASGTDVGSVVINYGQATGFLSIPEALQSQETLRTSAVGTTRVTWTTLIQSTDVTQRFTLQGAWGGTVDANMGNMIIELSRVA